MVFWNFPHEYSMPLSDLRRGISPYGAMSAINLAVALAASDFFFKKQTNITPVKSSVDTIEYLEPLFEHAHRKIFSKS